MILHAVKKLTDGQISLRITDPFITSLAVAEYGILVDFLAFSYSQSPVGLELGRMKYRYGPIPLVIPLSPPLPSFPLPSTSSSPSIFFLTLPQPAMGA